jgi:hypothetical protein
MHGSWIEVQPREERRNIDLGRLYEDNGLEALLIPGRHHQGGLDVHASVWRITAVQTWSRRWGSRWQVMCYDAPESM